MKKWTELFGAAGLQRTEEITTIGGLSGFSDNRFEKYQQLYTISPYTFISIQKLGLSLTKDFRFEGKKGVVKNFEKWSAEIDLDLKLQTMVRLSMINGTYVALYLDKKTGEEEDIQDIDFVPLLMSNISLLPDGIELNHPTDENAIMLPPITKVVVDEKFINTQKVYRKDNCFIFTHGERDIVQKDILGRETYGIYGISLFNSIEETIYRYIDLIYNYSEFVKKFGISRYFMSFDLLATMIKDGEITLDEGLEIMQAVALENSNIKANEDICGLGFSIEQLDNSSINLDVRGMKDSFQNDIAAALLQSTISLGSADKGSYATGYMAENSRIMSLEGYQVALASALNGKNGIIGKRLEVLGKKSDDIKIVFPEISKPQTVANDYYSALLLDAITMAEYRVNALSLPAIKPEDSNEPILQKENTQQPNTRIKEKNPDDKYPEYPSDDK